MSSTLDEYNDTNTETNRSRDRTQGHDAPPLINEGHVASGDRLMSIQTDDMKYWFAERSRTTLELWSIDTSAGDAVPSEVVAGTVYEDLPCEIRLTLKLEGYRMVQKNGLLASVMSHE